MTNEQLDKEIAKIVGWQPTSGDLAAQEAWESITGEDIPPSPPRYSVDLNLIAEVEKIYLTSPDGISYYGHTLLRLTNSGLFTLALHNCSVNLGWAVFPAITATARQRAEALILTAKEYYGYKRAVPGTE